MTKEKKSLPKKPVNKKERIVSVFNRKFYFAVSILFFITLTACNRNPKTGKNDEETMISGTIRISVDETLQLRLFLFYKL